jgi:uncharacterized protein
MKLNRLLLLGGAIAAGLLITSTAASAQTYRLMTGPQGGVWVPLGGALKNAWEKAIPGVTVQTLPGAGIANIRGVDEDKAEIGFGNSTTSVDGINGAEPYPRKTANVCQLASLYPQYFQVVVLADANINSVRDLKGKSVAVQTRGNTAEAITQHILQAYGLNYSDMKVNFQASYLDAISLMKDGHAQAFTLGTTIPASSVMDLASARDMKLLDLTDAVAAMKKINAGYSGIAIKANTYPKQTRDVTAIGYAAHLVVSCKLPEAHVYTMARTIAQQMNDLSAINGAMAGLTAKDMAEDVGVPLHPGARRFYREAGAIM